MRTHGKNSTYHSGCRCDKCRDANREDRRRRQERGLPPNDPRHGTANGYFNFGCRCDACRVAAAEYMRAGGYATAYNRRKGHRPRDVVNAEREAPHGTESRYKRCRCDECRAAANSARNERRRANPGDREAQNAKRRERRAAKRKVAA